MAASLFAQTPGTCELGTAEADLDVGDVFARVFNTSALFFGNSTFYGYHVPKLSGNSPIFAAGFWIGGRVDEEIRVAGARYTRYEMWPGPLGEDATLPNPSDCSAYDHIYVVSRDDVRHYLETGVATNDLAEWPAHLGAPVLDGDGTISNYNLEGGDQPAIMGDQMAWWVMNDVGNVHEGTGSDPLGIELQVSAFAASRGARAIEQATYYRYVIINRNSFPIDSAYVSLFVDADLGDATDDWIGSDTTLSMGYVFNGDDFDNPTYGIGYGIPPAQGYQVVQGPVGLPNGRDDDGDGAVDEEDERLGMTAFFTYPHIASPYSCYDFHVATTVYQIMVGSHCDGFPITEGGMGYQSGGPATAFYYPGDPVTGQCWSMANDCEGGSIPPKDQRLVIDTGPFRLEPSEATEVVFALPFALGSDNLDSVTQLRAAAHVTQAAWDTGFLAPQRVEFEPVPETFQLQVSPPFPNPFTEQTTIRYELPEAMRVRMTVSDALGREVAVLVDGEQQGGSYEVDFDGADLAPGTYVVRFEAAGEERAFSIVKLR